MPTQTHLRKKGQFTIPVKLREEVGITENDPLTVLSWEGKALIVIPQRLQMPALLKKTAAIAKKRGVTLEDLLAELDDIRHQS